jgi:hypothetical protein
MQLSILIATNRTGFLACSRIAQACSWAAPNVEVIVRDNSGDPRKRELLAQLRRDHCNIILAEPCDMQTNFVETLRQATGEFVFLLADDDYGFDHAVAALPALIEQHGKDPSVAGVTGGYVVESSQGSAIVSYPNVESEDVVARVAGYLSYGGANILQYAPVRQDVIKRTSAALKALPFCFSFHDQIMCLLYLLNGKFVRMKRLLYLYDLGPWEQRDSAQKRDLDFYRGAGLDPAINTLHWFLCAFEGAVLARHSDAFPDYPLAQRQAVADRWFSSMFIRFKGHQRLTFDSPFAGEAQKIGAKLLTSTGQLQFKDMLTEICGLIALFSEQSAHRYFDYWDAAINQRKPPPRVAEMALEKRAV